MDVQDAMFFYTNNPSICIHPLELAKVREICRLTALYDGVGTNSTREDFCFGDKSESETWGPQCLGKCVFYR